MNSIIKSASQQIGQLGRHIGKQIIKQPGEILKNAIGQQQPTETLNEQALSTIEQGQSTSSNSSPNSSDPNSQKIQQYAQLAQQRDQLELAKVRKQLHRQFGLPTDLETGMSLARQERQQRKKQEEEIEEQKKQQEKLALEQKKEVNDQVLTAKAQANAETGIGRRIAG